LKVLYIGSVGPFGGASRSLYEVLGGVPKGALKAYFLMPKGTALTFYRRVAADVISTVGISRFDHTRVSHYRGKRWLILLRETMWIAPTLWGLLRARRRWGRVDIVHVNEFTELPVGVIAKRLFGAKLVVHVRALVNDDCDKRRTRWLHRTLARGADAVVAIDGNVRATLPADLAVDIIHNSFAAEPREVPDAAYLAQFDRLRAGALKVGFVGNLLFNKGIVELVRAAALVRQTGADVQFVIVGGGIAAPTGLAALALRHAGLGQNAGEAVRALISELGLENDVLLFGPTADIQRVYPRLDVLAFPSHLDAPGRPVFEAALAGVPSIVAARHPTPDTLVPDVTGIAIPESTPEAIAAAVLRFVNDPVLVRDMGAAARTLAEQNCLPAVAATKLRAVYARVLRAGAGAA
jgi:glycosyltransferase involved in cell wall biosynthesis